MEKINKKVAAIVVVLAIIFICAIIYSRKSPKRINSDMEEIKSIQYTLSGGFGTIETTCTKSIKINVDGTFELTNDYKTDYVYKNKLSKQEVDSLVEYVKSNKSVLAKGDISDKNVMDGSTEYIIVTDSEGRETKVGGYAADNAKFNLIRKKIISTVGEELFDNYCEGIKD